MKLDRRGFLGSIFAAAFAPNIPASPVQPAKVLPPGIYTVDIESCDFVPRAGKGYMLVTYKAQGSTWGDVMKIYI